MKYSPASAGKRNASSEPGKYACVPSVTDCNQKAITAPLPKKGMQATAKELKSKKADPRVGSLG
jgi:hypothetical protein